jgi:hypothetical protein
MQDPIFIELLKPPKAAKHKKYAYQNKVNNEHGILLISASNIFCLSGSMNLGLGTLFHQLLKQKMLLNNVLLSSNEQDTSHNFVHVD